MALNTITLLITLNGTGAEIPALNTTDYYAIYSIVGTGIVAVGNYAIVPTGTPTAGLTYTFEYEATLDITTNGTTFSIFGTSLTQLQLNSKLTIVCKYNGTTWKNQITGSLDQAYLDGSNITNLAIGTSDLDDLSVTTGKLANNAVTNAKMATMAAYTVKANNTAGVAVPTDVVISTLLGNAWGITGNAGTTAGTNFIGTTDAVDLVFKVNSIESGRISVNDFNTSLGKNTLASLTTGQADVAIGYRSMLSNTSGNQCVAIGDSSLELNSTGGQNVSIGASSSATLVTGGQNTIIGTFADVANSNATHRIALGYSAQANVDYQFAIPTDITTVEFGQAVITTGTSIQKRLNTSAVNATGTATAAQVKSGYITSTSLAPTTITLPTGTLLGASLGASQGTTMDLFIDNTAGSNTVTVAVAVDGVLSAMAVANAASSGLLTIPTGVTGIGGFRIVFSSATTYVFTRIS